MSRVRPQPQLKHYQAVFISPHLDDAVFSCGAEIIRQSSQGPILVINVFTQFLEVSHQSATVLDSSRYLEEENASALLNFESLNLNYLDAFFRKEKFRKITNIFKPDPSEQNEMAKMIHKDLENVLLNISFEHLYAPLGIGWHIDHCICFQAALLGPWRSQLRFYEDTPYVHIAQLLERRIQQLNQSSSKPPFRFRDLYFSFQRGGMMRSLGSPWLRGLAMLGVGVFLYNLMRLQERDKNHFLPALDLHPLVVDQSSYFAKKIEAVKLYESQIKPLFGEAALISHDYRFYSKIVSPEFDYCERYWTLA